MPKPHLDLSPEMIERAARTLDYAYDRHELTLQEVAETAIRAAFEGVPIINYGIGLGLQFFDLVICVKDGDMAPRAGVYRAGSEPGTFDALGHYIDVSWGQKPTRYINRVAISKIDPPEAPDAA